MFIPLISAENLHQILRVLYESMIDMCEPMASVASAIAGIGAMLYISYRVWQSLARAEPIDLFPLLRPFAISICIMFFPTLVLGSINGLLSHRQSDTLTDGRADFRYAEVAERAG